MIGFRNIGIWWLFLPFLVIGAGGPPDSLPVMRVAQEEVPLAEFRTRYIDFLLRRGLTDGMQPRRVFTEALLAHKLVYRYLHDHGVANDPEYRFQKKVVEDKLLLEAYAQHMLYDTLQVTEAELRELFVRMNTRLKARHLYARTEEEAWELYHRLQEGASFEALAREVFRDTMLAHRGGSLGYFGFDEMDPAFEEAAFRLRIGEISPPVRTAQGYSIIQLEDRQTHPLLTEDAFVRKKRQLRAYLLRRKRTEALFRHSRQVAKQIHPVFEEKQLPVVLEWVRGGRDMEAQESVSLDAVVATYREGGQARAWRLREVIAHLPFTSEKQRRAVFDVYTLKQFLTGLLVRSVLLERARRNHLDTLSRYREAVREVMESRLYAWARSRIADTLQVPDSTLRAHFEAHRADYMTPPRREVWEIVVSHREEADSLMELLAHGADFQHLAARHTIRPGAATQGGYLGWVTPQEVGMLSRPIFEAKEGDILGPFEIDGRAVLLKVGASEIARHMTFEEARPRIEAELREQATRKAFVQWIEQLKMQYPVEVYYERIAQMHVASGL